jgi:hypothetical protein
MFFSAQFAFGTANEHSEILPSLPQEQRSYFSGSLGSVRFAVVRNSKQLENNVSQTEFFSSSEGDIYYVAPFRKR